MNKHARKVLLMAKGESSLQFSHTFLILLYLWSSVKKISECVPSPLQSLPKMIIVPQNVLNTKGLKETEALGIQGFPTRLVNSQYFCNHNSLRERKREKIKQKVILFLSYVKYIFSHLTLITTEAVGIIFDLEMKQWHSLRLWILWKET